MAAEPVPVTSQCDVCSPVHNHSKHNQNLQAEPYVTLKIATIIIIIIIITTIILIITIIMIMIIIIVIITIQLKVILDRL